MVVAGPQGKMLQYMQHQETYTKPSQSLEWHKEWPQTTWNTLHTTQSFMLQAETLHKTFH